MPKFRNISGQSLEIPAAKPQFVDDDGVFEVSAADAPGFECQPSNYEPVVAKKSTKESE